jgi:putative ABC transport system ATP-binding protein
MAASSPLQIQGLAKRYGQARIFEGVNLELAPGEFVAIVGDSGVGKSTLLNCMAGLDSWDAGQVLLCGQTLDGLGDDARALLRRQHVGFVFQAFHVLPHLDVNQNIALPLMLLGRKEPERVSQLLDALGLSGLGERLPQQLSGGQLQRVAIARALVHRPALLLADEPTGNLDPDTSDKVFATLMEVVRETGLSALIATHNLALAARMDRIVRLEAGRVVV